MRLDRQSTFNYGESVKAGEIATGALQEITGNLLQEIDAGSKPDSTFTTGTVHIYVPTSNFTAAPAHLGYVASDYGIDVISGSAALDKLPMTVLQVSRYNAVYSATAGYDTSKLPPPLSSNVSSTLNSANNRNISPDRWNKPLFMSGSRSQVPTAFSTNPPQWIYVTRAGSKVLTDADAKSGRLTADLTDSNSNAVLGRYAYVIYDEGALLDINVAGYVYSATTDPTQRDAVRGKSYLAYADLTRLPGLSAGNGKTLIEDFVKWRNKNGLAITGNDYSQAVSNSSTTGFLTFTGSAGNYDNPVLSRQDLLDFLTQKIGNTNAAPYLTTFTRSISAPSWYPTFNATSPTAKLPYNVDKKIYEYENYADDKIGVNRDLPNVRFVSDKAITHYMDSGTAVSYNVKAGDQLMTCRFTLKRIEWLANNPNTGTDPDPRYTAAIQQCFGLRWDYPGGNSNTDANGGNKCWNYVGSDNNGFPGIIKTLDQVATEGREPNFFELLKAAILNGSLGRAPGKAAFNNGNNNNTGNNAYSTWAYSGQTTGPAGLFCLFLDPLNNGGTVPAPAQIPDMQIIQIGANIIDQYDEDGYPTAIYFKYDGVGGYDSAGNDPRAMSFFGPVCMVYGNENLPYLTRVGNISFSPNRADQSCQNGEAPTVNDFLTDNMGGWIQPEIWNPHQEPATAPTNLPHHFQIRAYGSAYTRWSWNNLDRSGQGRPQTGISDTVYWYGFDDTKSKSDLIDIATIDIFDNSTTSSFYANPFMVRNESSNYPNVTVTSAPINMAKSSYYMVKSPIYGTTFSNTFVAFTTGTTTPGDRSAPYNPFYINGTISGGKINCDDGKIDPYFDSNNMKAGSFVLGWVTSSGKFYPYSFLAGTFPWKYSAVGSGSQLSLGCANPAADGGMNQNRWIYVDPRTSRFSFTARGWGDPGLNNFTLYGTPKGKDQLQTQACFPQDNDYGFYQASSDLYPQNFLINSGSTAPAPFTATQYYKDPDGIIRPGDGLYVNRSTGDGLMLLQKDGTNIAVGTGTTFTQNGRRPVILNRPFRSVGELGYVFRDLPFKTLDFFSPVSADAALLDVFSLTDEARVSNNQMDTTTAGQFNLSNAPKPVIEAVIAGGGKKNIDASYNLDTEAGPIAQNIANYFTTGTNGPLRNRAELVTSLSGSIHAGFTNASDLGNKPYFEAPVRALSDVVQARTWNLMIDVISQAGRIKPNASGLADFIVEGERRYWLHIAIDRYTGKVISQQLEPVYE
jgi:hypothetical protein